MMRVLVGIAERGGLELLAALDMVVPLRDQELVLAHVIDTGARGELERVRGRLRPPRPLPPHRALVIGEAERDAATAALDEAAQAARARGAAPTTVVADGEPGRVLAGLARDHRCGLVAVGSRVDRRDEPPGPRSVGRTARFVVDHSPCPVLLVRGR